MTLRAKFIFVLIAFCIAVGINIYAAMLCSKVLLEEATAVLKATVKPEKIVESATRSFAEQDVALRASFQQPYIDPAERQRIRDLAWVLQSDLDRMHQIVPQVSTLGEIGLKQRMERHQNSIMDYLEASNTKEFAEIQARFKRTCPAEYRSLSEQLQNFRKQLIQAQNLAAHKVHSSQETINSVLFGLALSEFAVLVVVLSFFREWMLKPIHKIKLATEEIATGNLDYRLQHMRNDELGALADQVNRMAQSLSRAQEHLKQSERMAALGEMTSVIAHNLRNPLAGIRATAQASMHALEAESQFGRHQERIMKTVDSLEQWLKELLHLNRPIALNLEATDVDELVADLKQVFQPVCERKNIEICYAPIQPQQMILIDRQHFVQAMASILDNAIEASPADTTIHITTEQNCRAEDRFCIEIADAGSGVPDLIRQQVFETYFSTKPGGTGIGLAMAKKIIEAHSGALTITDESTVKPSTGAVFRIEIPNRHGPARSE